MHRDTIKPAESFESQIKTMRRLIRELQGRWVVQRFKFDRWAGIQLNPTIPENPISEASAPITGVCTYATSAEAVEAMERLIEIARTVMKEEIPMRVATADHDIYNTQLAPRRHSEYQKYTQYPTWGYLMKYFPELGIEENS